MGPLLWQHCLVSDLPSLFPPPDHSFSTLYHVIAPYWVHTKTYCYKSEDEYDSYVVYLERELSEFRTQDCVLETFGELFDMIAILKDSHSAAMTKSDIAQTYEPGFPHGLNVRFCFQDFDLSNTCP